MNKIDTTLSDIASMAMDMCPHEDNFALAREITVILGGNPMSDEGIQVEHERSHMREALVVGWREKIERHAKIAALIAACLTMDKPDAAKLSEMAEDVTDDAGMYTEVILLVLGMVAMEALDQMSD